MKRSLKNLNIQYEQYKLLPLLGQVLMGVLGGEKVSVRRWQTSYIVGYSTIQTEIEFESKSFKGRGNVKIRRLTTDMWRLEDVSVRWDWKPDKVIFT